ncbi:MAG TPA: hypothetical protein VM573_07755 [Actinomycetota bacterium]|jgi:hypothetical protein|nr:hypothetical protein [Actinomycetota bacterium]
MGESEQEDLEAKLDAVGRELAREMRAAGMHEPDWAPLEKVLPRAECAGFMFFGYSGEIRTYKHGFTRRCLHIDPCGRTYAYDARRDSYTRIPRPLAIAHAFSGLAEMGYTRTTRYDEHHAAERRRRLRQRGWKVVTVTPDTR